MNYTYDDFVMESAMVEITNDTLASDIQMEQWNAEFNVACAAFDAFNKYALIAEYATCDVDEFVQESLDSKIDKIEAWKNSGGKAKKILGTIGAGALKIFRAVANFFKNLFSKQNNPFRKLANYLKANSKKTLRSENEKMSAENEKLKGRLAQRNREKNAVEKELGEEKALRNKLAMEGVELNRKLKAVMKEAKRYKTLYTDLQQSSAKALEAAKALAKAKGADVQRLQGQLIHQINKFNEAMDLIKKNSQYKFLKKDLKAENKEFIDKYDAKETDNSKNPTMEEVVEVLFVTADVSEKATENIDSTSSLMPDIKEVMDKIAESHATEVKTFYANIQTAANALQNTGKQTVDDMRKAMESEFASFAVK